MESFSDIWLGQHAAWPDVPEGALIYDRHSKYAAIYQKKHWLQIISSDAPFEEEELEECAYIN